MRPRAGAAIVIMACGACGAPDGAEVIVDGAVGGDGARADAARLDDGALAPDAATAHFSFFVTSLDTMRAQSGSQAGFGGDLGGLAGADAICEVAAAAVGFGSKTWRAFLSVTDDGGGQAVNAIDRIGVGPWYDRNGRLIAADVAGLLHDRPLGDPQTIDDLPDEFGVPLTLYGDTHDVLTGSNQFGQLQDADPATTCADWTSAVGPGSEELVACGHSWPAPSGQNWIRSHNVRGCAPGVNLVQNGPGEGDCVGCGGGWGGIYCFALEP